MLVDYHTHHYRCGHASGTLEDVVKSALARGLTEIGLSDHSPIYHFDEPQPFPNTAMHPDELPRYVDEMLELRERYAGRIAVRLGIESDYILGWDDFYRELWDGYPLDFVIGSVHWLADGMSFGASCRTEKPRANLRGVFSHRARRPRVSFPYWGISTSRRAAI